MDLDTQVWLERAYLPLIPKRIGRRLALVSAKSFIYSDFSQAYQLLKDEKGTIPMCNSARRNYLPGASELFKMPDEGFEIESIDLWKVELTWAEMSFEFTSVRVKPEFARREVNSNANSWSAVKIKQLN